MILELTKSNKTLRFKINNNRKQTIINIILREESLSYRMCVNLFMRFGNLAIKLMDWNKCNKFTGNGDILTMKLKFSNDINDKGCILSYKWPKRISCIW